MKNLILILTVILTTSCQQNDSNELKEQTIVGTWKLTESKVEGGSPNTDWTPVAYSYQIQFLEDGTFTSNKYDACEDGTYSISSTDNTILISYACPDFSVQGVSDDGDFLERYSFKDGYLVFSPTYMSCDEGCAFRFKRI